MKVSMNSASEDARLKQAQMKKTPMMSESKNSSKSEDKMASSQSTDKVSLSKENKSNSSQELGPHWLSGLEEAMGNNRSNLGSGDLSKIKKDMPASDEMMGSEKMQGKQDGKVKSEVYSGGFLSHREDRPSESTVVQRASQKSEDGNSIVHHREIVQTHVTHGDEDPGVSRIGLAKPSDDYFIRPDGNDANSYSIAPKDGKGTHSYVTRDSEKGMTTILNHKANGEYEKAVYDKSGKKQVVSLSEEQFMELSGKHSPQEEPSQFDGA